MCLRSENISCKVSWCVVSSAGSDKTEIWHFLNLTNCQGWTRLLTGRKAICHNSVRSMLTFPSRAKLLFSREHWPVEQYDLLDWSGVFRVTGTIKFYHGFVLLLRDKTPRQRHYELVNSTVIKKCVIILATLPTELAIHCSSSSKHRTMRRQLCFPCADQSSRGVGRKVGAAAWRRHRSHRGVRAESRRQGKINELHWAISTDRLWGKLSYPRKDTDISQYIIPSF